LKVQDSEAHREAIASVVILSKSR